MVFLFPTILISKSYAADYVLETLEDHTSNAPNTGDLRWFRLYSAKVGDPSSLDSNVVLASALLDLGLVYLYESELSETEKATCRRHSDVYSGSADGDVKRIGTLLVAKFAASTSSVKPSPSTLAEAARYLRTTSLTPIQTK